MVILAVLISLSSSIVSAAGTHSDGVWSADGVEVASPADGVRIYTVKPGERWRVLVVDWATEATVELDMTAMAAQHVHDCPSATWRPMNSFTTDTRAPAAYGCLYDRTLADAMLSALNRNPHIQQAMQAAFNVTSPCSHREGRQDPKVSYIALSLCEDRATHCRRLTPPYPHRHAQGALSYHSRCDYADAVSAQLGGTWLRNYILYHFHARFRATRAWTALINEDTTPDAVHSSLSRPNCKSPADPSFKPSHSSQLHPWLLC